MADLSKLQTGLVGRATVRVGDAQLATAVGSGVAPVFASPMLIALMEAASVDCVEKLLPEGYQSLGTHLDVAHTAPTPRGLTVTAEATLIAIAGRKLTFRVAAHDGVEAIGAGTHMRIVVDTPRFMARLAAKAPPLT
ncbi:MAG: thioesterase family protein [Hyphomicrobium sp.]|nr:thioesterase family protein [Hyphomicrobium sp.]